MPDFSLPGHRVSITSRGIARVTRNDSTIGVGGTTLVDPRWFVSETPYAQTWTPTLVSESIDYPLSTTKATVRQAYAGGGFDAAVVFDFSQVGADITIRATVTNKGTKPWTHVAFSGITFPMASDPPVPVWPTVGLGDYGRTKLSYTPLVDQGKDSSDFFYPSSLSPIALTAFRDMPCNGGTLTWACWPWQSPTEPMLTFVGGIHKVGPQVIHLFPRRVDPGGSAVVGMVYRFTTDASDAGLFSGYKATVRAQAPMTYTADVRPLAQFANFGEAAIRPDNPYGYHDGGTVATCQSADWVCRRFDRADGAAQYPALLVPAMQAGRLQGILGWQWQGCHPRSGSYRPDFNVFPAETRALTHTLTDPFRAATLKCGFQMRPSVTITSSADARYDTYATASVHPGGTAELVQRVQDMIGLGFTPTAYLDSFPMRPQDQQIVQALRRDVPGFLGYCEHATIASAPYLGAYGEVFWNTGTPIVGGVHPVISYVYPEVGAAYAPKGLQTADYPALYAYMLSHKLTPFVPDYLVPSHAPILRPLVDQYIGANNQWT